MTRHRWLPVAACGPARNAAVLVMAHLALSANAHDTWFAIRAANLPGTVVMALGTGNQFPVQEFAIDAGHLQERGCRQAGVSIALKAIAKAPASLLLSATTTGAAPATCWSQLIPFEIELAPDKVDLYLDEIKASTALRERWAAMQARGLPWRERYVKSARVEIAASVDGTAPALPATPAPMTMDVLLTSGLQRSRTGDPLAIQVLRDGVPLPGFSIELRGTVPGTARWFRTDAQGRVSTRAPPPGRWVWRGTDLRPSASDPDTWDSCFVTLAFEVHAAAAVSTLK